MSPEFIKIVYAVAVKVLFVYTIINYFDIFLLRRKRNMLTILTWVMLFVWQYQVMIDHSLFPIINIFINLVLFFLIALLSYADIVLKQIVFSLLYCSLCILVEFIIGYFIVLFGYDYERPVIQMVYSTATTITMFLITGAIKAISKNKDIKFQLNDPYCLAMILVLDICIFTIQIIVLVIKPFDIGWSLILSILIFIIQAIVFMIFRKFSEAMHIKYLNALYRQNFDLYQKQAQSTNMEDMNIKVIYHDLKNHFTTLDGFINAASDYLKQLMQNSQIKNTELISNTRCIAVDSIINQKYAIARDQGVDFQVDLTIFPDMMFESMSLSIIIGNAIDNALEATLKLPEKDRFIKITMEYNICHSEYHVLEIEIENTYVGNIKFNNLDELMTSKKDIEHHGVGMQSIKNEVQKYGGTLDVAYNKKTFILKAKLYVTREEMNAHYGKHLGIN